MVARQWPVLVAGALTVAAAVGFLLGGVWVVVFAGVLGFSTATVFVLTIALPPLLVGEHDVHRLRAAIFTITYACPFVISLVGGAVWDSTGVPYTAFLPIAATGFIMIGLVLGLDLSSTLAGRGAVKAEYGNEPSHQAAGRRCIVLHGPFLAVCYPCRRSVSHGREPG